MHASRFVLSPSWRTSPVQLFETLNGGIDGIEFDA